MTQVKITGIGAVTACGQGVAALLAVLEKGSPGADYRVATQGLDEFVPAKQSRRMDNFTRMAVLAACLAVRDAGSEADAAFKSGTGIVFGSALGPQGSSFSFLDGIMDGGDNCASSFLFTNSVHSTAAAQVALTLGIRGPMRTITAFSHTAGAAFASASSWITSSLASRVMVILTEETSAVQQYGADRKGARGPIRPFGKECSYVPGEGCVAFILEDSAGGYCALRHLDLCLRVEAAAGRAANCDMLFSAAAGRADEFETYSRLWSGQTPYAAYSPFYGSLYAGLGFELAIAALSLKKQVIFPVPGISAADKKSGKHPMSGDSLLKKVAIAAVTGPDRIAYVELGI
jgi:3-oxoacyl-[acyl-carrier-protein] synthase II